MLATWVNAGPQTTRLPDSALEHILANKRTLMSSLFWLLGFFLVEFILAADELEQTFVGQSGLGALLWFFGGVGIILVSTFSLVSLRQQDEYDLIRNYGVDEFEILIMAASEAEKSV